MIGSEVVGVGVGVWPYRAELGAEDVQQEREDVGAEAQLADPAADGRGDVRQHGGQSAPVGLETRGGLAGERHHVTST